MNEETPTNTADVRNPPGAEEDMSVIYANNSHIDATIWDLQVILGEYSPSANRVDWHTTVTMPWAQAKLMAYYLQFQISVYEYGHGAIQIPKQFIPETLPAPTDPTDEREKNLRSKLETLRDAFIASLPDDPNPRK